MIWHPFVALGCVFMIERIVQEENLLFKCLVPFTLFLYARYGVRTTGKKKTPVIIRHLFLHFHIN
ncbi:hypothetical protein BB65665_00670 [Bacillus sp. 916]|nr:hypothetical protein KO64_06095 [Bacillus subtilis]AMQ71738.1 hypothetical protein BAMY6639_17640 [Bacillus amyloliquefaciens UMAF6639]AMQ75659.1 hypothetical protein BAMY6614_10075 [Bacillus amyloliquefaciens UMAF6614]AMR49919.1 hypothetical protein A1R12_06025 [Bacillus amyloliquefaciens]EJD69558.1 hypothetical protein BB65665_00670 [Bacillus sp. 916]ODB71054.1 hypothetical protein A7314_01725 [Bacillus velezensis]